MSSVRPWIASFLHRLASLALGFYEREPLLVYTYAAAAIVAVASFAGIVVDKQSVLNVIEIVIPILVGGHLAHRKVSPAR